jgi:chemotaxis response regulator CheB
LIKVLVVDDSTIMRSILQSVIAANAGFSVVGTAGRVDVGRRLIAELTPDIVTIDLELPDECGLNLIDEAKGAKRPAFVVISASTQDDGSATASALARGAAACFDKALVMSDVPRFLETLRKAASRAA